MKHYLKARMGVLLLLAVCCGIFALVFRLYHLPVEAVLYPGGICMGIVLAVLWLDYCRLRRREKLLERLALLPENLTEELACFDGAEDEAWRRIIGNLTQREQQALLEKDRRDADRREYYTTWVHQIKTPIASARLMLENEDTGLSRGLEEELRRIEQYVQMVLTYQRLDDVNTDYVFRECSLDALLRSAVRRFAGQFIRKGIRLDYRPTEQRVITDEKWLSFVLEQLLSNALKYTLKGTVFVGMEDGRLCIRDTGIGIAAEDLPRIFQRGYTGCNGRTDRRATGLGLYLCGRICQKLGHGISVESALGEGTAVFLDLRRSNAVFE